MLQELPLPKLFWGDELELQMGEIAYYLFRFLL